MTDLSNPNGTVFGLMPDEWQEAMLEYYRNGGKVEWFGGADWLSRCAGIALYNNNAYRAAPEPLIPDSIDWSHVADEFICMARDGISHGVEGRTKLYVSRPDKGSGGWVLLGFNYAFAGAYASFKPGNMPWGQSLVWRPGYGPEGKQ